MTINYRAIKRVALHNVRLFFIALDVYKTLFGNGHELVLFRSDTDSGSMIHGVCAHALIDTLYKIILARIRAIEHHVQTCLIQRNRVKRSQHTEIRHLRLCRVTVAIAIHRQTVCHIDVKDILAEMIRHSLCSLSHRLAKIFLLASITPDLGRIRSFSTGMNPRLSGRRADAD